MLGYNKLFFSGKHVDTDCILPELILFSCVEVKSGWLFKKVKSKLRAGKAFKI